MLYKSVLPALLLLESSFLHAQQYVISTYAGGAPQSTPVSATAASIGAPAGVAADAANNVYFTGDNCVFRLDPGGTLVRIAGNSRPGFSGDGGPAITSQLNNPNGIAFDTAGNLYIADVYNYRVRKVSPAGVITTIAGNGTFGLPGEGVPAISSPMSLNGTIALDNAGNLYLGDSFYRVRRISPAGIITTVAGTGTFGYSGDGGPAVAAQISGATGLATDNAGNLYLADGYNLRVRKLTPQGIISTIAGVGIYGSSGDGGPATNAQINEPDAITIDGAGSLYIADASTFALRKISTAGVISTVYSGDAVRGTTGGLLGLAVDSAENVYASDNFRYRVRRISAAGVVGTAAGNGNFSYSGDGGPAVHAQLFGPQGLAFDKTGDLYLTDTNNGRVRMVSSAGLITTVAGDGTYASSGDGGPAINAEFFRPSAVAYDPAGNLYIADSNDPGRIRKVSPAGIVTTIAGNGAYGFSGDGGPAINAQVYRPSGLATDSAGNLYVADAANNRIRRISAAGIITTIAGNGTYGSAGEGGTATNAELAAPFSVAVDQAGDVYIYDQAEYDRITMVSPQGVLTRIAGKGDIGGPPTTRQQYYVNGLAVDSSGTLYFTDSFNYRVRRFSKDGTITTIAGTDTPGYSGDGGLATLAQLINPINLTVDSAGGVYVSDNSGNAIRRLQPISSAVTITAVTNGASDISGPVSPGEIVVLYGSTLGPAPFSSFQLNSAGEIGTQLAGTSVTFNGKPAPILYTSDAQAAVIVPYEVSGTNAQIAVTWQGQTSAPFSVPVGASAPGLFTLDATGGGQAVAFNQDGSLNSAARPAPAGSVVSLYATGEGQTSPAGVDGSVAQQPAPHPVLPVTVSLGGQTVTPQSAGGISGQVEGLMQINLLIPAGISAGTSVPVVVNVGGNSSQPGVTLAIGGK